MQSLPNMILEDDEFSGTIFLEYLQSIFGLNEPVAFLVSSNLNMDICTDLYNYLLDNQKKINPYLHSGHILFINLFI